MEQPKKLNLIYGKSGTGKSELIYQDIKQKMDVFKNIFIIVPEQSNLTSEKKFFEVTGKKCMLNVEVLTLSRMAYRISNETGEDKTPLSKVGKSMILYDLLNKNRKNLNFLGKSEKNIDLVGNMLTELKKHNISLEMLKNVELEDEYTKLKLKDIERLYEKYEERLADQLIDENDQLTKLSEQIKNSEMFENASIYIDEFFGFTPQEYVIFEELLKKCDEMTVSVTLDKIESTQKKENDIFYFNRLYAKKILEIAERQQYRINLIFLEKPHRFKNEELLLLEKNLYAENQKYEKETRDIQLFLANNPYSEIENVAKKIYQLVKEEGYKYREIGIVTNEIANYAEDAKAIFQKYNIPIFIDEKKDLNQNILIKYILSLLDIFTNQWSYDAVFNYLKLGLLDFDYYTICVLENYCKKWGIRGAKWYKQSFSYEPLNEKQEELETMRKHIVEPLMAFKQSFMQNKTVLELTQNIYQFLIQNKVIERLDEKIKSYRKIEVSNELNTSYKILIHILEEMVTLFGEEKITFETYQELLTIGIQASELGKIPATQDQVMLGDLERTRSNKIKVLFVLGMNDGLFPKENKQEGYFNDKDRNLLTSARNRTC